MKQLYSKVTGPLSPVTVFLVKCGALVLLVMGLTRPVARAQAPAWHTLLTAVPGALATIPAEGQIMATVADANGLVYVAGSFSGQLNLGTTTLSSSPGGDMFVACWNPATNRFNWAQQSGTSLSCGAYGLAVANGKVYVGGSVSGVAPFGGHPVNTSTDANAYVARLDAGTGQFEWVLASTGPRYQLVSALAVEGSNVYLSGRFTGPTATFGSTVITNASSGGENSFVAKVVDTGLAGQVAWVLPAGGDLSDITRFGLAANGGNVYVVGELRSATARFGALTLTNTSPTVSTDGFVAKVTDGGSTAVFTWVQGLGGSGFDTANDLAVVGNTIYVAGQSESPTLTLGSSVLTTQGNFDAFVARLTDTGPAATVDWGVLAGGPGHDFANAVAVQGSSIYIAGFFSGAPATFGPATLTNADAAGITSDVFVAHLLDTGRNGQFEWARQGGGSGSESAVALTLNGTDLYVAGTADIPTAFGALAMASPSGTGGGFLAALATTSGLAAAPAQPLADMAVYPNPAHTAVRIRLPQQLSTTSPVCLTITDALGHSVRQLAPAATHLTAGYPLDLTGLAPGLYLLRLTSVGTQLTRRLVVE